MQGRLEHLRRFYDIVATLERDSRTPSVGRMPWAHGLDATRHLYFFMEEGERRTDTGNGLRIVRVGTHALKAGSRTALWHRLSQHKGQERSGGGNHRGSIFRLLVGSTLMKPGGMSCQQLSATRHPSERGSRGAGSQPDHQGDAIRVARGR